MKSLKDKFILILKIEIQIKTDWIYKQTIYYINHSISNYPYRNINIY